MSQPLSFTRILAQPDGTSRMVRSELPLALRPFAADTPPLEVSAVQAAHGFQALRFPADWAGGWHRSPHRQWGFVLSGAVSVTTSDGVSCELRSCWRISTARAISPA